MATIIEELNRRMPTMINRTTEEYLAIFGDEDFTPNDPIEESEDFQCGATANELEYVSGHGEYVTRSQNPDNYYGEYLQRVVEFFTGIKQRYLESDDDYRNRFYALVRRKNNPSWITKHMIKDVFSYFFDPSIIYVIENDIVTNLTSNHNFEAANSWTYSASGSSTLERVDSDQFERTYCAQFYTDAPGNAATLSQTITGFTAGTYMLSFWVKNETGFSPDNTARVYVQRDSDNYYYNFDTMTWQVSISYWMIPKTVENNYEIRQNPVVFDGATNATLYIQNLSTVGAAYTFWVDVVKFGVKPNYPTVTVLLVNEENPNIYAFALEGGADPIAGPPDYSKRSYFGQSYMLGTGVVSNLSFYQSLLDIIKPAGVYAIVSSFPRTE